MGVAVQHDRDTGRRPRWRDVREKKFPPLALEPQLERPEIVPFVVAEHDMERPARVLERHQCGWVAHIPEVPDLVGILQPRRQFRRESVVGVGDDRDAPHLAATARDTYGASCRSAVRRPGSSCTHTRAQASTTSTTNSRNTPVTAALTCALKICPPNVTPSPAPADRNFSPRPTAAARKPNPGAPLKTSISPAV